MSLQETFSLWATMPEPHDGRWCSVCGGEITHHRRINFQKGQIETWLICSLCRTRRGPTLTESYG